MKVYRYNKNCKIAFKYYLNRELNPDHTGAYPIYVLICLRRKNTKVRSRINQYLKHESEIAQFGEFINKEVDGFYKTIRERWGDSSFKLRELSHTPKEYKKINYQLLIEFFRSEHGLDLDAEQVTKIVEAVNKSGKQKKRLCERPTAY